MRSQLVSFQRDAEAINQHGIMEIIMTLQVSNLAWLSGPCRRQHLTRQGLVVHTCIIALSSLVQAMAWHLRSGKPLHEPTLTYYRSGSQNHNSVKFKSKYKRVFNKRIWRCHVKHNIHFVRTSLFMTFSRVISHMLSLYLLHRGRHCFELWFKVIG